MAQTIRNGQKVWPYCGECGCRLNITEGQYSEVYLTHFGIHPDKDARGCYCSKRYALTIVPLYKVVEFL